MLSRIPFALVTVAFVALTLAVQNPSPTATVNPSPCTGQEDEFGWVALRCGNHLGSVSPFPVRLDTPPYAPNDPLLY